MLYPIPRISRIMSLNNPPLAVTKIGIFPCRLANLITAAQTRPFPTPVLWLTNPSAT